MENQKYFIIIVIKTKYKTIIVNGYLSCQTAHISILIKEMYCFTKESEIENNKFQLHYEINNGLLIDTIVYIILHICM